MSKQLRSFGRWIADGISGTERIRVAVVGAKGSGKTVLLTALRNYLRWLATARRGADDQGKKMLAGGWEATKVECCGLKDWPEFDYGSIRNVLSQDECWPDETGKYWCMQMDIAIRRDKKERKIQLQMLDIPGERFSDLGAMSGANYQEWCERVGARKLWCARGSRI